jgi:Bacterial lectin
MKHLNNLPIVKVLVVFVLLTSAIGTLPVAPARAGITITESFTGGTASGWTILPAAMLTAPSLDPAGSGWLRLTSTAQSQAGAAFFSTAFPSDAVFDIEFDYATWGGNGADGLTFFLMDGSATPAAPGGSGGGLGYSGIAGAYFAVGFDEYDVSGQQSNVGIYEPGNNSVTPDYWVSAANIPASRTAPNHVHIIFYNNFVSVWLAGVQVIADFNWNAPLPATVKFGFSAGTGVDTNNHEIRNATIRMIRSSGILHSAPSGYSNWPCGESWESACTLETALDYAVDGVEIWAAQGTYYPGPTGLRTATFHLKNGVAVYGGFAGTENSRDERNPDIHGTILSGDIDRNGTLDGSNAYHVVTCSGTSCGISGASALLDGVVITMGNADGATGTQNRGGGMLIRSGSPTLENLTIMTNKSGYIGGGLANVLSDPQLTNVIFADNEAYYGGGMSNEASSATLRNVAFSYNTAHNGGGGMYDRDSSPTLTNVTFSNNMALYGGGISDYDNSSPTLTNVTFIGNGLGVVMGGGMYVESSNPVLINVTFTGNGNKTNPGGCRGGAIYSSVHSNPVIKNSIMWGDKAEFDNEIHIASTTKEITTAGATVFNSVIQGGCPSKGNCGIIITGDPKLGLFGHYYGGFSQTVPLLSGSSAIDVGDDSVCPATDQNGVHRPQGAHCDIGAVEYVPTVYLPLLFR